MAGPTPKNQFSFSRVKSFNQCAAAYRYRYLKKKKEAFRSVESYLGNVVHDTLEWLYHERDTKTSPTLEAAVADCERRFAEKWAENIVIIRIDEQRSTYENLGRDLVTRFHQVTFSKDRSETIALEQRLALKLTPEIHFTGFADRIGRTAQGRLFVVDYKTSKSVGDKSEFSEGLQAPLYAHCALKRYGDHEALAGYHYLRHEKTNWISVTSKDGEAVMQRFTALANEALSATEFPATPAILCAWCGFNNICPSAQVPEKFSGGLRYAEASQ